MDEVEQAYILLVTDLLNHLAVPQRRGDRVANEWVVLRDRAIVNLLDGLKEHRRVRDERE